MAIRDESTSTQEILRDSRYHRAALKADPKTAHLAKSVEQSEAKLKKASAAADEAEDLRTDGLAVLLRTDFELDERLRTVELEVLRAVERVREAPGYKAVFPKGLSALVALRGDEEAREVLTLLAALKKHHPKIEKAHEKELKRLAKVTADAETDWKDAEAGVAMAFGEEVVARTELVRQLQKNEGALVALYPGQRRRVRSFFRPTRRRGAAVDTGEPEPTETSATGS